MSFLLKGVRDQLSNRGCNNWHGAAEMPDGERFDWSMVVTKDGTVLTANYAVGVVETFAVTSSSWMLTQGDRVLAKEAF